MLVKWDVKKPFVYAAYTVILAASLSEPYSHPYRLTILSIIQCLANPTIPTTPNQPTPVEEIFPNNGKSNTENVVDPWCLMNGFSNVGAHVIHQAVELSIPQVLHKFHQGLALSMAFASFLWQVILEFEVKNLPKHQNQWKIGCDKNGD